MPTPRSYPEVAAINGILYVAGGQDGVSDTATLEAYNPSTDMWTSLPSMPSIDFGNAGRYQGAAAVINGNLAVIGGWRTSPPLPTNSLETFDPVGLVWSTLAPLPTLSGCGVAGTIGTNVYLTTACDGFSGYRQFLHVYNTLANNWTQLPDSPNIHVLPAGGAVDGKFYVAGGHDGVVPTSTLDVYDPVANVWATKTSMPLAVYGPASGASVRTLYAVGGYTGAAYTDVLQAYNRKMDSWTTLAPMPTPRTGAGGAYIGGKLYVVGGSNGGGNVATLEVFTPPTQITSLTATPASIFPSDRRLVRVRLNVVATDDSGDPPTCEIDSVVSNQAPRGVGPDIVVVSPTVPMSLDLRAERPSGASNRKYTITVVCTNGNGAVSPPASIEVPVTSVR